MTVSDFCRHDWAKTNRVQGAILSGVDLFAACEVSENNSIPCVCFISYRISFFRAYPQCESGNYLQGLLRKGESLSAQY